ncbi:peptidoglycan DD-metalloendopeptidase family protein [Ichthyenterobacterium magnum]|uniref:Peptidase M23-like protein n=1 Tax=Ichthyenterobacterium magnum TaxID=1230530 RepID=A0A420DV63_9FLAO|nr:peptidoglycan DD-metalloendopeptidase family protein [Ichthyenterobacterium magnum]RKE98017.1 peptidase M23-like protein [Ichthyenterobacterium magnum]
MSINNFSNFLNSISSASLRVLDASISNSKYIALDLSKDNKALKSIDVSSSEALENYISNHIKLNTAKVAFGGYLEQRSIYKRSNYFNDDNPKTERNIHLGVDLWIAARTPIYTPLHAMVHSFKNNTNFGDYGPTLILKHSIEGVEFYTLYGHLSIASIENLKVGQEFKQGEQIATLGDATVNGDYPPHLHFQIIKDLQNYKGDYPGVSNKIDLEFYKVNCPNPNLLLKLI